MNRLKILREEKGLLQEEVGKFLGISGRSISNYENGNRDMSPDTIIKLADFFGVSTDYLLGKSEIRNPEEIINGDFAFAYHKATEGLSEQEIKEAIEFYKKIKYGNNKETK